MRDKDMDIKKGPNGPDGLRHPPPQKRIETRLS
jgi:hypothetical protein